MFWPDESIGVAAPMCVVGAMIARSDAIVITAPADAARAPSGETYTITGTGGAELVGDNVIHRTSQTTWCVQLDHQRGGVFALGLVDRVADE